MFSICPFDFHAETKLNFTESTKSVDILGDFLDSSSFFQISDNGTIHNKQTGVVRTNCLDCLDRTNVIQVSFIVYFP